MEFIRVNKLFRNCEWYIWGGKLVVSWIDSGGEQMTFSISNTKFEYSLFCFLWNIYIYFFIYIESYYRYFKKVLTATEKLISPRKLYVYLPVIKSEKFEARFFARFVPFVFTHWNLSSFYSPPPFFFFISFILSKIVIFDNQTFIASLRGRDVYTYIFTPFNQRRYLTISPAAVKVVKWGGRDPLYYPRTKYSGTIARLIINRPIRKRQVPDEKFELILRRNLVKFISITLPSSPWWRHGDVIITRACVMWPSLLPPEISSIPLFLPPLFWKIH